MISLSSNNPKKSLACFFFKNFFGDRKSESISSQSHSSAPSKSDANPLFSSWDVHLSAKGDNTRPELGFPRLLFVGVRNAVLDGGGRDREAERGFLFASGDGDASNMLPSRPESSSRMKTASSCAVREAAGISYDLIIQY